MTRRGAPPAPYLDGRAFAIGLRPLDQNDPWLQIDARRASDLAEKRRIIAETPLDAVFRAEPGTETAQAAVLARVDAVLADEAAPSGDEDAPGDADRPPLLRAALRVSEDLFIMRRDGSGWRLVAAALFFPTSWRLSDKFGLPLDAVHGDVPGFATGARNAAVIARIFDNLAPNAAVERFSWSYYPDARLRWSGEIARDAAAIVADPHIRVERQTLTKLPETGDVLFTVRIHVQAAETLAALPDGAERLRALAESIDALSAAERDYKTLEHVGQALADRLRAIAKSR